MKIIVGYPDDTFRPNQSIIRAEVTTLLVKFLNTPQMSSTNNIFSNLAKPEIHSDIDMDIHDRYNYIYHGDVCELHYDT